MAMWFFRTVIPISKTLDDGLGKTIGIQVVYGFVY